MPGEGTRREKIEVFSECRGLLSYWENKERSAK
jgi:hypothetical protein